MRTTGILALLALSASLAPASGDPPKIVPFPSPPPGPKIRRVTHDAVKPVLPGAKVAVTVLTEPKMKVTLNLGSALSGIPCAPKSGEPGGYLCEAVVPAAGAGPQRVQAVVTDSKGRSSSLSAVLPVIVEKPDPWAEPNALNVRLSPAWFAEGSADLDAEAKGGLAKDADLLRSHPALPIAVEGHCDAAEKGDLEDLSRRRAEAVRDHLATLGVPAGRMTIRAKSASQPLSPPSKGVGNAINRRAMVLFEPAPPKP